MRLSAVALRGGRSAPRGRLTMRFASHAADGAAVDEGVRFRNGVKTTLLGALNNALDAALARDPRVCLFGEDVAFGGVFRVSNLLLEKYGRDRVFNTPLAEQGIAGFAIGMAAMGYRPVAEIQFADYIFPAFDQLVNEAAKYRFRSGGQFDCGGLVVRAPCGAVGHGGLYHSQSVESFFAHVPGLVVVSPSTPSEAKGLLLACIESPDPCLFFEPKALYRIAQEPVNPDYYTLPLGKARVVAEGRDVTLVGWGPQMLVLQKAAERAKAELGVSAEVIDLRTVMPWDKPAVEASVRKTGRLIVSHEENLTGGFGAEVCAAVTQSCFLHLEAPPRRVCGLDTPFPLVHERLYLPGVAKVLDAIREVVTF
eukprot:EG_transcript_14495